MSEGDDATPMLDQRPYLLRALNDWIVDSGSTPHVLVDATEDGVCVPSSAISDGRVVLNISPTAVRYLDISADGIAFEARFGGVAQAVHAPLDAILAIYARENGAGMAFEEAPVDGAADAATSGSAAAEEAVSDAPGTLRQDGPDDDAPPPRGRPGLRVVK